jgi:amidase
VEELLTRSAVALAALVRAGEVSPRELTEAALRRADARGDLGAFTHLDPERALADADAIARDDGRPFAGVPTAIKDNRPVAGWPLTMGATITGDYVAPMDAFLVRRLRDAGFVLVGKTNLPEFGILPTSEPARFGPARNPWNTDHTPGGSSGGAAAAVAGGILPVAHGNDGGGSLRIPAACCGLVGLKVARGRISQGPFLGDSFLVEDGMLTRTVEDTAALLDVLEGYEPGDATWAPPPAEPFAAAAAREPGRLRIGMATAPPLAGAEVHPISDQVFREGAAQLESLGHTVEPFGPPWHQEGLLELFTASFGTGIATSILIGSRLGGHDEPREEDMEPLSWLMWDRTRSLPAAQFSALEMELKGFARRLVAAFSAYDAVLTPALAERPPRVGTMTGTLPDPEDTFRRSGAFTPFTALGNASGLPAVSLPLATGEDGLPAAIQLFGRPAGEAGLLALAAQVEAARPWAERLAPGV